MSQGRHEARMRRFTRAGLYLVTSQEFSRGRPTPDIVRRALAAGVRLFQLREKAMSTARFVALARRMRALTAREGALLIINDRLDVALAVGADGVHLGLDDLPVADARRLAPELIVGASAHSPAEARSAQEAGASYVNIGPLFPTGTKRWEGRFLGLDGLRRAARALKVPFTVMGGIRKEHVAPLSAAGARTFAVVTAVTAADDPMLAAEELLAEIRLRTGGGRRT